MTAETIDFHGHDGKAIYACHWAPGAAAESRAVVQIAHGMGEHIGRYAWAAARLNAAGYLVYGNDHRGHGRTDPQRLGDLGADGWNLVVADALALNQYIGAQHPGLKRTLLGHSMGAMLAQQYLCRHGGTLDGAVLSGSPGVGGAVRSAIVQLIARIEAWRLGHDGESTLLANLVFGQANKAFSRDGATGFEWLSRDGEAVRQYVDDPYCGTVLRAGSLLALFQGAREAAAPASLARIPKGLPIHLISGTADPVHGELKNLDRLLARCQAAGLRVTRKLYESGRHELFNETNRDEVLDDLIGWLNSIV